MVPCVMVEGADVPLLDHVTLAGVVHNSFLQQVVVPNISPEILFFCFLEKSQTFCLEYIITSKIQFSITV